MNFPRHAHGGAVIGLATLSLIGCVTAPPAWNDPPPTHYVQAGRANPLVLVVDVPLSELPAYCGTYAHGVALACAVENVPTGIWFIYTSTREAWVMDHEFAHVGGWEHE